MLDPVRELPGAEKDKPAARDDGHTRTVVGERVCEADVSAIHERVESIGAARNLSLERAVCREGFMPAAWCTAVQVGLKPDRGGPALPRTVQRARSVIRRSVA